MHYIICCEVEHVTQAYCLSFPFRAPAIDRTSDLYGPWVFTVAVFLIVRYIDKSPREKASFERYMGGASECL